MIENHIPVSTDESKNEGFIILRPTKLSLYKRKNGKTNMKKYYEQVEENVKSGVVGLGEFSRDGKHMIVNYKSKDLVKDFCIKDHEMMSDNAKALGNMIKNLKLLESFSFAYRSRSREVNQMSEDLIEFMKYLDLDAIEEIRVLAMPTVFDVDPKMIYETLTQKIIDTYNKKIVKKVKNEKGLMITIDIGQDHAYFSVDHTIQEKELKFKNLEIGTKVLTVKVGEIYLKLGNRNTLMNSLQEILRSKLDKTAIAIENEADIHFVVIPSSDSEEKFKDLAELCAFTPGINLVSECITTKPTLEDIVAMTIKVLTDKKFKTLQINVKDKHLRLYKTSVELKNIIVKRLVEHFNIPIYGERYKSDIVLDIRVTHYNAYLSIKDHKGVGGLPIQKTQRVVSLISGGMDSPVASFSMMKRGCKVTLVHFQNSNSLDQEAVRDKILRLAKVLSKVQDTITLYVVPFNELQEEIVQKVPANERMLVYRRFMTKIASTVAFSIRAPFIVLGDSFSQVASQTVNNLEAIYNVSEKPILSPLIGLNKEEIIDISRFIGTYEISKLPYGDCCSYFLGKHPALHMRGEKILLDEYVALINKDIVKSTLRNSQILEIRNRGGNIVVDEIRPLVVQTPQVPIGTCTWYPDVKPISETKILNVVEDTTTTDENLTQNEPLLNIYLDNASTTKVDPEVIGAMIPCFGDYYGNSNSNHLLGKNSSSFLESSRKIIAQSINAEHSSEIIFTSGGTESNNTVIFGVALQKQIDFPNKTLHVITTKIEHPSVMEPCKELERRGFEVTYLSVDQEGFINIQKLAEHIKENTILLSIVHGNNEIGTIQNLYEIGKICREKGVLFHTDACQSYTKAPINVREMNLDFVTLNAHKIHGPKGIGALYIRKGIVIKDYMTGGGQEYNMRSGTVNIPGIVGFAKAVEIANVEDLVLIKNLCDKFYSLLNEKIKGLKLNGPSDKDKRLCNNLSIIFPNIESESILSYLSKKGIFCSAGSACSSQNEKASHVLVAIGRSYDESKSTIRFSLSKFNTLEEIQLVATEIINYFEK